MRAERGQRVFLLRLPQNGHFWPIFSAIIRCELRKLFLARFLLPSADTSAPSRGVPGYAYHSAHRKASDFSFPPMPRSEHFAAPGAPFWS